MGFFNRKGRAAEGEPKPVDMEQMRRNYPHFSDEEVKAFVNGGEDYRAILAGIHRDREATHQNMSL